MTSKRTNCLITGQRPNFSHGQKIANEQAITWTKRRKLWDTWAAPLAPQKRGQTSGYNDISRLLCQKDAWDKEKGVRPRASRSKVWRRRERPGEAFSSTFSSPASPRLYVNGRILWADKWGHGCARADAPATADRIITRFIFQIDSPFWRISKELNISKKYNVFYWGRLLHLITRFW